MKQSNPELARAFRAALKHLSPTTWSTTDNKSDFICIALVCAADAGKITFAECYQAQNLIRHRLGSHGTLGSWLQRRIGARALTQDENENKGRKLQATRRRWLRALIQEFA